MRGIVQDFLSRRHPAAMRLAVLAGEDRVGVRFASGGASVYLPKVYAVIARQLAGEIPTARAAAMLLVRTLRTYAARLDRKLVHTRGDASASFIEGNPDALAFLEAALTLVQEYKQCGLYFAKAVRSTRGSRWRRIDWPKTLRRQAPLSDSEPPVYMEVTQRVSDIDRKHLLHQLHATCTQISLILLGDSESIPDVSLLEAASFQRVLDAPAAALDRLGAVTFNGRGRRLVELLRGFLASWNALDLLGSEALPEFVGVSRFEYVWQDMVDYTLGRYTSGSGQVSIAPGKWSSANGEAVGIAPYVDTIRIGPDVGGGKVAYVLMLDAKDKVPNDDMPSGSAGDYYKQGYYWRLARRPDTSAVLNALVFPRLGSEPRRAPLLRPLGAHRWPLTEPPVVDLCLDYELAARIYSGELHIPIEREIQDLLAHHGFHPELDRQ